MTNTAILFPVFVQVALTLGLILCLGLTRVRLAGSGEVQMKDVAINSDAWPDNCRKLSNCVTNQFQTPMLFYVLAILLMITSAVDMLQVILAWTFVASRIIHARIHTGSNNMRQRFNAFLVGFITLAIMWAYFAFGILIKSI